MYNFSKLLKKIRKESGLTQADLAKALGVSTILISMVESGQKEVSKNLIVRVAKLLDVHPGTISSYLFERQPENLSKLSKLEKSLFEIGIKLQVQIIKGKTKQIKKYAS